MENIPMKRAFLAVCLIVICCAATAWLCNQNCKRKSALSHVCCNLSDHFYIAANSREIVQDRVEAAKQLNEEEKTILRRLLTQGLHNEIDTGLIATVTVLGVVGDASTISNLEKLRQETNGASGRLNYAIANAIDNIRSRQSE